MIRDIRLVVPVIVFATLSACGGGSSSPPDFQGEWQGSFNFPQGSSPVTAAFKADGSGFVQDDESNTIYVIPANSGSSTLGPSATWYPGMHVIDAATGLPYAPLKLTGTASGSSISGTFTDPALVSGNVRDFSLSPFTPFSGNPSLIAGQWQGFDLTDNTLSVVIDMKSGGKSSTFTGSDGIGCTWNGSITQVDAGVNLFDVSMTLSGPSGCSGKHTGLGFESTSDSGYFSKASGDYFYIAVWGTAGGSMTVFKAK